MVGVEIDFAVAMLGEEAGEVVAHVGVGIKRGVQAFGIVVARVDEFGVGAQAARELPHGAVDSAGFGFDDADEAVEGVLGTGGFEQVEDVTQDAVKQGLRERDGDVRQEVGGAEVINVLQDAPAFGEGFAGVVDGVVAAKFEQVVVEVVHPAGRQFADPGVVREAAVFDEGVEAGGIAQRCKRQASGIDAHGVLVAVDVAVFFAEPRVMQRRQPHQREGVIK